MQFPKLTPLQSRLAASLTATFIVVIIYLSLSKRQVAYAAELGSPPGQDGEARLAEDHPWWRVEEYDGAEVTDTSSVIWDLDFEDDGHDEEDEAGASMLRGRASTNETALLGQNNVPGQLNINSGERQLWLYPNTTLRTDYAPKGKGLPSDVDEGTGDPAKRELRKREMADVAVEDRRLDKRQTSGSRTVYISINTCIQPTWNGTRTESSPPPQLTLYVSTSSSNTAPGPTVADGEQQVFPLEGGFANFSLSVDQDLYLAVYAPSLSTNFTGFWNYEVAASIDDYYHRANPGPSPFLLLVDTDTQSALLVTDNLTEQDAGSTVYQEWMASGTPFIIFAQNAADENIIGLEKSFCGLQTAPAQIMANIGDPNGTVNPVQMGMITRGLGNKPKQQFFVKQLNGSSTYTGILAMQGNSTAFGPGVVGGGGQVWPSMSFSTKSGKSTSFQYGARHSLLTVSSQMETANCSST